MTLKARTMGWTMCAGVAISLCGAAAMGQTATTLEAPAKAAEQKSAPARMEPESVQTFYLSSVTQVNDANEILTTLRNMLDPRVRIFMMPSENSITMRGTPDQIALAQRLLKELDRPKKTFRLVYTVTETEGAKKIGVQHFAMVLASGARTVMKQGSRIPVATGTVDAKGVSGTQTQFTYLDVGLNIDATVDGYVDGVRLRTKVEQSSVATEMSGMGVQDPVIRQTLLEGTSILKQGKPLVLGALDVPGSPRHMEVEVVLEVVP